MATSAPAGSSLPQHDLEVAEELKGEEEKIYVAPPWRLMWWRFRRHRMAVVSAVVLACFYFVAIFCEFVAPYNPEEFFVKYKMAPPTRIHIRDAEGRWHLPFVYRIERTV
ncbi:MAG: ABC transporter permease, partial [Anaerolineae bacterium]|nr:ABC transporter permease [Anaerolineae bacterium]